MESNDDFSALREAELARDSLAADIVVPRWHDETIGAAVAVQIGTAAIGLTVPETWARVVLGLGLVVFGTVAVVSIRRFRRANGVQVRGWVSKVVFGSAATASFGEAVALVVAFVAASRGLWWLVVLTSIAGGAVYVLSGRRWLRAYRQEPERLGRGESLAFLALVVLVAVAGLVLLVQQS